MASVRWQHQWDLAKKEWASNQRLQAISLMAAALFALWGHVQLDNWRLAKQADAHAALVAYYDTQAVAKEQAWLERAKASEQALVSARTGLWSATSEGEAEAKFRDWLQQLAKETGVSIDRIIVEVGVAPKGVGWRPVRADFQGKYQAGAWQAMLQKMSTNTPIVLVDFEQLNIVNSSNLFYRLNLTAWFLIGDTSGAQ